MSNKFMDGKHYVVLQGGDQNVKPLSEFKLVDETLLADGKIFVGDATGKAADVTMSGVVAIDNTGATTVALLSATAGAATASKAVILNSDKHLDEVNTAKLSIGATGAEVAITATPAHINLYTARVNSLIDYLADGLWLDGTLTISATPDEFKTTSTTVYSIGGVTKTKAATDNLTFSQADTVTAPDLEGIKYGGWVVQINAAGDVSTLAETGQSGVVDMAYESEAAALTAAKAITLTADNVALGYIVVSQAEDGVFTANTTALTGVSTFTDGDEKSLPTKLA